MKPESEAHLLNSWDRNWYENLFTLTAEERKNHAREFLGDMIASYAPLTYQRDVTAREVLDCHLLLNGTLVSDPTYPSKWTDLLDVTRRLSTQHDGVITALLNLWNQTAAVQSFNLGAMNDEALEFHDHFRSFIEGYALLEAVPGNWTQQLQIHDTMGQRMGHTPTATTEAVLERKYADAIEACVANPPNLELGKQLAERLLQHIGITSVLEAKTRMLLHNFCSTLLTVRENLTHLTRAKLLFVANPGSTTPNTLIWIDIKLADLERQELINNARVP